MVQLSIFQISMSQYRIQTLSVKKTSLNYLIFLCFPSCQEDGYDTTTWFWYPSSPRHAHCSIFLVIMPVEVRFWDIMNASFFHNKYVSLGRSAFCHSVQFAQNFSYIGILVLNLSKQAMPYTAGLIVVSSIYQDSKQMQAIMNQRVWW